MIKRCVVAVPVISIALSLFAQTAAFGEAVRRPSATHMLTPSAVPVGASFVVTPPMADYVRELDPREQREQRRDWAVLGTLARFGATSEQLAAATYQTPPGRLPYLDELYDFEYGRGRRAYLGNRVLLFRDADDPDPQATIGRLADRVRMENGESFGAVEIYLVDDQRDLGTIRVTRAPDVARGALFSRAYGYAEREARDMGELAAALDQFDDLTSAKIVDDGGLVLGGRRFAGTPTANITAEDVAAIYQAHQLLGQRRTDSLAKLNALPMILRDGIRRYIALSSRPGAGPPADAARAELEAALRMVPRDQRDGLLRMIPSAIASAGASASPGFSLDPEWLPDPAHPERPLMLARLRAFAADPCADLERIARKASQLVRQEPDEARRTSRTAAALWVQELVAYRDLGKSAPEACSKLKASFSPALMALASQLERASPGPLNDRMAPYHRFMRMLEQRIDEGSDAALMVSGLFDLRFHEEDTRVQCARYEGIAGTRVGMTLFYTDLLAKVWGSTDFGHSAPVADVPGFLSRPWMDIPKAFEKEMADNSNTRFWFGVRSNGVSRDLGTKATGFLFDHRFTRVHAAGSNPAKPGMEVQPHEGARRAIAWWNRHFDELADYEPEYHRQNQIMKWALVTAALPENAFAQTLGKAVVFRGFQFAGWQSLNRANLRFAEALPRMIQGIVGKECIPVLSSYPFQAFGHRGMTIFGGVSTVEAMSSRIVPTVDAAQPLGARVSFAADLEAGTTGTITRARPVLSGETVTFEGSPLARTRSATGDVALGTPRVNYAQGAGRGTLAIEAGEGPTAIGEVGTRVTKDGVALRWEEGAIERARLGKPELGAQTLENADKLAGQGYVTDAAKIYERGMPPGTSSADKLAREAVVDIARSRPRAVLAKLEQIAAEGKQLSPQAREALVNSVRRESGAAAHQLEEALAAGKPLNNPGRSLGVARGRIIVTRDVTLLPRVPAAKLPTDLSNSVVYVDRSLRVAQEGLLPDTGAAISSWRNVPGVKVVELRVDSIGALPDQIVETSTGLTIQRAPELLFRPLPTLPPAVFLIQKCDADHKTATTLDDC